MNLKENLEVCIGKLFYYSERFISAKKSLKAAFKIFLLLTVHLEPFDESESNSQLYVSEDDLNTSSKCVPNCLIILNVLSFQENYVYRIVQTLNLSILFSLSY